MLEVIQIKLHKYHKAVNNKLVTSSHKVIYRSALKASSGSEIRVYFGLDV